MHKNVTKENLKFLNLVVEYRSRTIGVCFTTNTDDLVKKWEEAQFELGTKYQYEGDNEKIWDYYLVLCCDFDEASLENELRFKIESNRFCCRKVFMFNQSPSKFNVPALLGALFPQIESSQKISILKPEDFIPELNTSHKISREFFTRRLSNSEINKLMKDLIAEASLSGKDSKD